VAQTERSAARAHDAGIEFGRLRALSAATFC
jgi:hypothetical protein